jgi:hypothetical protein
MGPKQGTWVQAVQRRIATTSTILRSIKSVKMTGLVDSMRNMLQSERVRELRLAKSFRWLIVWLNVIGKFALSWSGIAAPQQCGAVITPFRLRVFPNSHSIANK